MRNKRIGFVDYRLENFHANTFLAAIRGELSGRGFDVAGCIAHEDAEGRAWAEKNRVEYFTDPRALDEHVDCYMVLAPSNPETHLELCKSVFPFAKPTYIDKTFAPDLVTAKQIFALADRHHTPVQTSSALRYTRVQEHIQKIGSRNVRHMVAWGAGGAFKEYAIHPLELVVSCMGPQVERLLRRGDEQFSQLLLDFTGGRSAVVNVYVNTDTPFAASVTSNSGTNYLTVDGERLFVDAMAGILDFLEKGEPLIDRAESLVIRRLLDEAEQPSHRLLQP